MKKKFTELNYLQQLGFCFNNKKPYSDYDVTFIMSSLDSILSHGLGCKNCPLFVKDERYSNGGTCYMRERHIRCCDLIQLYNEKMKIDKHSVIDMMFGFETKQITKTDYEDDLNTFEKMYDNLNLKIDDSICDSYYEEFIAYIKDAYHKKGIKFNEQEFLEFIISFVRQKNEEAKKNETTKDNNSMVKESNSKR